jgi:methionyl-tRNA formyltransferase
MNIVFFSSSDFVIPLIEDILALENSNLSLWQVFVKQYQSVIKKDMIENESDLFNLIETLKNNNADFAKELAQVIKIKLVVSQPNRLNHDKIIKNPVVNYIEKYTVNQKDSNITLFLPERLKLQISDFENLVNEKKIDIGILASYGQILPAQVLNAPKYGLINWHPSLLPKYRGPTPMQTALLNGDEITGLTWLEMTLKMDAGNIWLQLPYNIKERDNFNTLAKEMISLGKKSWTIPIVLKLYSHYINQ